MFIAQLTQKVCTSGAPPACTISLYLGWLHHHRDVVAPRMEAFGNGELLLQWVMQVLSMGKSNVDVYQHLKGASDVVEGLSNIYSFTSGEGH